MTKKERADLRRHAGPMLRDIRENLGATRDQLYQTRCLDMGRTMLSRTENGERVLTPWDIVKYVRALAAIDRRKAYDLIRQAEYAPLCLAAQDAVQALSEEYNGIWGQGNDTTKELAAWLSDLLGND